MDRVRWTDERLDEKMDSIDANVERIFAAIDDLRAEIRGLRSDFATGLNGIRTDITATQDRLVQIGFGLAFSLIAAVIALIVVLAT